MAKLRAEHLVETLGKSRQKIIIPTPATAELLTAIGPDAQQYLTVISRSQLFEIAPFDSRCARASVQTPMRRCGTRAEPRDDGAGDDRAGARSGAQHAGRLSFRI
jgi:hypothetical protein